MDHATLVNAARTLPLPPTDCGGNLTSLMNAMSRKHSCATPLEIASALFHAGMIQAAEMNEIACNGFLFDLSE